MTFSYPAIEVVQRTLPDALRMLLFAAPAGEISQWADVTRATLKGEGHQRRRNEAKVRAIKRFLESDERNTIPSSLTIALWGTTMEEGQNGSKTVHIPSLDDGGDGVIIDGQHRLYGAESYDPDTLLNVVAILDPDELEIAFQFLVINNKASKVPTDHIRLLAINIKDSELAERLRPARLSLSKAVAFVEIADSEKDSPFYESIIWPVDPESGEQRDALVRPAAIEVAISSISQKELVGLDNEDALISFFFALWSAVRDTWPSLWSEKSRLLGKAGLVAMTDFLLSDLTPLVDRGRLDAANPDEVSAEVKEIIKGLNKEFWSSDWTMASLDTSAGRKLIVESLQRSRRNISRGEAWYSGVSLVSTSASGADAE